MSKHVALNCVQVFNSLFPNWMLMQLVKILFEYHQMMWIKTQI